ncbi:hypothetical protein BDW74DRAFT_188990 [Aspergillus multicolor]|uniref:ferric reductase family protein n=1 Tax=Aspergillus multicolor TaxID=41759 RepID=UPI003CCD1691
MHILIYLFLLATTASARSSIIPVNERCVDSITTAYTYITFAGSPSRKFLEQRCQNSLAVTSIYASADIYCRPNEREAGIRRLGTICEEGGLELLSRESVTENLTEDAITKMRRVEYLEMDMRVPVEDPVLLSAEHYRRVFLTMDTWAYESWTHYAYGYIGYLYWACVLSIGMVYKMIQHFFTSRYDHPGKSLLSRHSPLRRIFHFFETHLLVPTMFPSHGRKFLCWTFSNRAEALVALGFWVLSTVLCAISYRLSRENIYWPETSTQLIRYMADRTGIISFANLPLLWLFAGRNNICAWATGWNFATFNVFHRHVAWIATIQAVVHTVLYIVLFFQNSNPWRKLQKPYLLWGTLAMVLMIFILPAAVTWFRHRAYETFLFIHIVFSIGLLVGCFYHTIIFETREYWFYLWLPMGIWAFDRGLRIVRVVHCNIHVHVRQTSSSGNRKGNKVAIQRTTSTASYDKAADLIRLTVIPGAGDHPRPTPGQYYFLYQPFRWTGWESHPFTLGSWEYVVRPTGRKCRSGQTTPTALKGDEEVDVSQIPLLSDSSSESRAPTLPHSPDASCGGEKETETQLKLTFYIRPYDGWTRALREQCLALPSLSTNSTILLEGPYGHDFPLWRYDSVLLIAGGTGIASGVPYIQDHIARSNNGGQKDVSGEDENKGRSTNVRHMHLAWVTRQEEFIRDLAANELRTVLGREDFSARFYATASSSSGSARERVSYAPHSTIASDIPTIPDPSSPVNGGMDYEVEITPGRPNLEKIISTFAEEAHTSDSSAAVLVCGPQRMADEARAAVVRALGRGLSVKYVEESFTW